MKLRRVTSKIDILCAPPMTLSLAGVPGNHTVVVSNEGPWRHWIHLSAECERTLLCYTSGTIWREDPALLMPGPSKSCKAFAEKLTVSPESSNASLPDTVDVITSIHVSSTRDGRRRRVRKDRKTLSIVRAGASANAP